MSLIKSAFVLEIVFIIVDLIRSIQWISDFFLFKQIETNA